VLKESHRTDDQQDYFQTDGSQWLTPEQRKQMKELEEERAKQRREAKDKVSISFDFGGRGVVVNQGLPPRPVVCKERSDRADGSLPPMLRRRRDQRYLIFPEGR